MGQAARSSGREGLLLRCLHLGSLLIHLLHSLRPLLKNLGLCGLSCRPLLLLLHCRLSLSGRGSLLLRCLHLGPLLIQLLHSLRPLLQSLGLGGLSCRPLLLRRLSGQCSLLLGRLLLLDGSLNLSGLDRGLLLLNLLPSLGDGICSVATYARPKKASPVVAIIFHISVL